MTLGVMLSGCSPQTSGTPEEVEPTTTTAPTASEEVQPTPTDPEPYASDLACVDCHTDKEMLIATASEVEETKPESSGEG
jgi:hypothetical protein